MSEVGRLNVRLNLDTQQFGQGLQTAQARIQRASQQVGRFGDTMMRRVTLPLLAIGGAIGGLIINAGNFADELLDLSAVTGISTDALQLWRRAAVDAGTDADAFAEAVEYLNRRMQDSGEFAAGFVRGAEILGVELYDTEGALRSTEDALTDVILALADIEDPVARAALGAEVLERRWEAVAPMVALGREELEKILGMDPVFSEEELQKLDEARKMWDRVKYEIGQAGIEIALALVKHEDFGVLMEETIKPAIDGVVDSIKDLIDAWHDLDEETQGVYKTLGLVAIAIAPVAKMLSIIGIILTKGWGLGLIGLFAWLAGVLNDLVVNAIRDTIDEVEGLREKLAEFGIYLLTVEEWMEAINLLLEEHGGVLGLAAEAWDRLIDSIRDLFNFNPPGWFTSLMDSGLNMGALRQGIMGFDSGGVVPGPVGSPQLAVVHGGETVLPTHKQDYQPGTINLTVNQHVTDKQTADYAADSIAQILQRRGNSGAMR